MIVVKLSKGIVEYLYGSRMTMEEIVTYLNENYGNGNTPFTKINVAKMFKANGYDPRKRPRQIKFQIIVEEDAPDSIEEIVPNSPDDSDGDIKEEEPTYFLNHNNN